MGLAVVNHNGMTAFHTMHIWPRLAANAKWLRPGLRLGLGLGERLAEYGWKPHQGFWAPKNLSGASIYSEGHGLIEFEISNNIILAVFRQPLTGSGSGSGSGSGYYDIL